MTTPKNPRKLCLNVFYLHVLPHWPGTLLWLLQKGGNVKNRGNSISTYYFNRFYGLRACLRTNVILSCHSNYKFSFGYSICWCYNSTMTMRGIFSRQSNTNTLFCLPFPFPFYNCCSIFNSLTLSSWEGSKKSRWPKKKL